MERKDNGAKQPRFCHRLFNFIMKNLSLYTDRQISSGRRNVPAQTELEESKPSTSGEYKGIEESDGKWLSVDEEGDFPLIPPITTIPVEHVEDKQKDKKKRISLRIKSGEQENEGEASPVRPAKQPVARVGSDIDKKVDDWIRLRKKSFESPAAS